MLEGVHMYPTRTYHRRPAFSLVELVIVIVIIGIIAAIAIPRISRGSRGATENSVRANLALLRNAVELYASEHGGTYPGANLGGAADKETAFINQLTLFSDKDGNTNATRSSTYKYGPYLRAIPPLTAGPNAPASGILVDPATFGVDESQTDKGWVFNTATGELIANTDDPIPDDPSGRTYADL